MDLLTIIKHYLFGGLLSLIIMTNPLSKVPLFISLTQLMNEGQKATLAKKSCVYALLIMIGTLFLGTFILQTFGISYGALRIAGGLTVCLLGYRMLFQTHDANFAPQSANTNYAFFPLALPSISGPGTIAVIIGISTEIAEIQTMQLKITAYLSTIISMIITCACIWLILRSCKYISKILGIEGMEAITRLMGFLLVCVGVQFIASGIRSLWHSL